VGATASNDEYKQTIRTLSDRIVQTQQSIRILDAIKWNSDIRDAFFASECREQPRVDRSYYESRPLGFDPVAKRAGFEDLGLEIQRKLGAFNPLSVIMQRICREYGTVVRMLEARGLPEFSKLSQQLYGGAHDAFHAGDPTLADLGIMMTESLTNLDDARLLPSEPKTITGEDAVEMLQERIDDAFMAAGHPVHVILSDGIVSDAAAGSNYIKIHPDARFNERDVRLLELHEGWVHLATTINGMRQPVCTFLSKGPPSSTVTQEGLAILMELVAFASYPGRLRRLTNRIRAVAMAQDGATFLDVFHFYRDQGIVPAEAYPHTTRVFRGSTPTDGPFTKDLSYTKGFVQIYSFIQAAVRRGLINRIPLLFCGKTTLEDVRTLEQLVAEGIVEPPAFLPPQIADMSALTAWMCFANFLNGLSLDRVEADFSGLL